MAAFSYSWERPPDSDCDEDEGRQPRLVDSTDDQGEGPEWNSEEIEDEDREPTADEAGAILCDTLLDLKNKGVLSNKQTCLLAYWACKAGCQGPVSELAYRPGASSGHYARHLKHVLKLDKEDERVYSMEVPGYCKSSASRENLSSIATLFTHL